MLDLFWQLIKGYFTHAWPFALAHLFVAYLITKSWLQIRAETNVLNKWVPEMTGAPSSAKESRTAGVLDDFVIESKKLGVRGFFVPMTDFSDRLDSIIDGMVGELHDRSNLFLIVGIAGTLFGVFEFSFRAYNVLVNGDIAPSDRVLKLGLFLSESMSRAFPVGFVGLALTFLAQAVAGRPEERLRKAVSEATKSALKQREAVIQSQQDNVRLAVERITLAMEPLKDLSATLTQITEKVISQFGVQLSESLNVVQQQFGYIREVNDSIQGIVVPLQDTATKMGTLVKEVPSLMKEQRASLENFNRNVESNLGLAQQVHSVLNQTGQDLNQTMQDFRNLPQGLVGEIQSALRDLREASLESWRGMSAAFADGLKEDYAGLLKDVAAQAREVAQSARTVSAEVTQVAGSANLALQSLNELPGAVQGKIGETFADLGQKSLAAWEQMSGEFKAGTELSLRSYLQSIQSEAEQIKGSLGSAATSWSQIAESADTALKSIVEVPGAVNSQIELTFETLGNRAYGSWDSVSNKIGNTILGDYATLTDHIKSNTEKVEGSLRKAASEWDRLAQNAEGLVKNTFKETFKHAEDRVADGLKKINRVMAQEYPQISDNVQEFSKQLIGLLSQVQTIQNEFRVWFDDALKAQAGVQELHLQLARTLEEVRNEKTSIDGRDVAGMLSDNLEQMRETNRLLGQIQIRIPSTSGQIQTALQDSAQELSRIRSGIERLADKGGIGARVKGRLGRLIPFRKRNGSST